MLPTTFLVEGPHVDAHLEIHQRLNALVRSVHDFGAAGDGVTDDAAAIQAAIDAGSGIVSLTPGYTYLTGATIEIGSWQHLVIPAGAKLVYVGPGNSAAIQLGELATLSGHGRIESSRAAWDADNPQSAIRLVHVRSSASIAMIIGFEYGVFLDGVDRGACYNTINVQFIVDTIQAVKLDASGTGWVNQNYIHAGSISIYSARAASDPANYANSYGIYIDSHTSNRPNANQFSGCVEMAKTGVYLTGCYNAFYGMRLEGCAVKFQIEEATGGNPTHRNWWFGGYGIIDWDTDITGGAKSTTALQAFGVGGIGEAV